MTAQHGYEVDWNTLPAPKDDGAAAHLLGMQMPSVPLASTHGGHVDLSALAGLSILYVYPKTGTPGIPLPEGWDMIPGARGCTPQSCDFRDHFAELRTLGADQVFGLSSQKTEVQAEAATRLHLPFALLSDAELSLAHTLHLPTFEAGSERLFKRLSLAIEAGRIVHVLYPVFPPDENAQAILAWLRARRN